MAVQNKLTWQYERSMIWQYEWRLTWQYVRTLQTPPAVELTWQYERGLPGSKTHLAVRTEPPPAVKLTLQYEQSLPRQYKLTWQYERGRSERVLRLGPVSAGGGCGQVRGHAGVRRGQRGCS